ncbi:DUF6612 family protein [Cytobacillus sp. FJAT-54145]|uniref:DUF6612 family protein n=1 Tax=Cytobacillus spartinae TaxID=3299023 RepID=A0ABW6KGF5_9BACI
MKKTLTILAGFFLVFMLAACTQTAEPVAEKDSTKGTNEEPSATENSELTLEEVLNKSVEASESLKSFSMSMEMGQEMASDQEEAPIKIESSVNMDIVTEPMAYYQTMSMKMEGSEEAIEMESYFSKDGLFLYDAAGQTWMKFPSEMSDQLIQLSDQQTNPAEELKKLQEFVDDFKFEQDDANFILSLNASGEKFNSFIKEIALQGLPPELAANTELMENMVINELQYTFVLDKTTFYPTKLDIKMNMDMTTDGQTINIIQNMNGEYTKYNELTEITIPEDVLKTAVEMEM